MEDYSSEGNQPSAWDTIGPFLVNAGTWVMSAAFVAAGLGALYLLFALFSGNLAQLGGLPAADRARLMGVVALAGNALAGGLAIGAICALVVTWGEESTGYILLGGAAVLGLGVPFVYTLTGGQGAGNGATSVHVNMALARFIHAAYVPGAIGAGLAAFDIVKRLVSGVKPKTLEKEKLTYGGEARAGIPKRTSLLAKCWEGPYCREFIRATCPIFLARKACWREKRGCYCEEDIVSAAASKVQGVQLEMVPTQRPLTPSSAAASAAPVIRADQITVISGGGAAHVPMENVGGVGGNSGTSFRRVQLTHRQKIERCKNCVIYNEHEREKYKIMMPAAVLATLVLCFVFASPLRHLVGSSFGLMDSVLSKISFSGTPQKNFGNVSETAEWVLVGAIGLMLVSKALQLVEWVCFKAKI